MYTKVHEDADDVFLCDFCDAIFVTEHSIIEHIQNRHREILLDPDTGELRPVVRRQIQSKIVLWMMIIWRELTLFVTYVMISLLTDSSWKIMSKVSMRMERGAKRHFSPRGCPHHHSRNLADPGFAESLHQRNNTVSTKVMMSLQRAVIKMLKTVLDLWRQVRGISCARNPLTVLKQRLQQNISAESVIRSWIIMGMQKDIFCHIIITYLKDYHQTHVQFVKKIIGIGHLSSHTMHLLTRNYLNWYLVLLMNQWWNLLKKLQLKINWILCI